MADVIIENVNELYVRINTENRGVLTEIADEFTFFVENYRFNPKFKAGSWDGRIRLLSLSTRLIYKGLLLKVLEICDQKNISYELDEDVVKLQYSMDTDQVYNMYKALNGPFVPHDFQAEAVAHCISNNRSIILSPTSSGKSYMLYGLARFYQMMGLKVLLVVHRQHLVRQLSEDNFSEEYDLNRGSFTTHQIYEGQDKHIDADITASTWQSIYKMPKSWFAKYDVILADEVHAWKAANTKLIMEKCEHMIYRHGFTGTLDDIVANELSLTGLFGPIHDTITTKELMDRGDAAMLSIKSILLSYSDARRKQVIGVKTEMEYKTELDYIYDIQERYDFLDKLISSLNGNVLIAFRHEKHGNRIFENLSEKNKFYVDGKVDVSDRIKYSKAMDKSKKMVGVVSIGTFAEGINIKNVNYVILACPLKAKVKLLQLIGRGLRLSETKSEVTFIDIGDNFKRGKRLNHALRHYMDRTKRYQSQGFNIEFMEKEIK
jgi:superfamily II DNA or RNA helicase